MIHPDTELKYISKEKGFGVVATKLIKKGTITWALDKLDREITPDELSTFIGKQKESVEIYSYRNNKGNLILCWDIGRYVNHSFKSNCLSTPYNFEIAVRDILPGEELTDDYGYLNVLEPFEPLAEEGVDRKVVYPDDLLTFHTDWDNQIQQSFVKINEVEQPLKSFLEKKTWLKIEKIISGKEKMGSILDLHYYDKK